MTLNKRIEQIEIYLPTFPNKSGSTVETARYFQFSPFREVTATFHYNDKDKEPKTYRLTGASQTRLFLYVKNMPKLIAAGSCPVYDVDLSYEYTCPNCGEYI